jgi:hypothetical protein
MQRKEVHSILRLKGLQSSRQEKLQASQCCNSALVGCGDRELGA